MPTDMGHYSAEWLSQWQADITAAVTAMASTFEHAYGYPCGVNEVRTADETDLLPYTAEPLAIYSLATFYASVGEVVLEDVGNGYFVHSARAVLDRYAEEGAVTIHGNERGLVFASDGGGTQIVIDQRGAIHRSTTASLDTCEFDKVADSLPEFLDYLRESVTRFASTGEPGDL